MFLLIRNLRNVMVFISNNLWDSILVVYLRYFFSRHCNASYFELGLQVTIYTAMGTHDMYIKLTDLVLIYSQ